MAQNDDVIRMITKNVVRDATKSLADLEWQIKKSAKCMDDLRSKMHALKGQKIPTKEYVDLQNELKKASEELSMLVSRQEGFEELGFVSGAAWDTLNEKISYASDKVDSVKEKIQALVDAGKGFVLGEDTEEYDSYFRQLQSEEETVVKTGERYQKLLGTTKDGYRELGNSAEKSFVKISKSAKESNGQLSGVSSMFKGFAALRSALKQVGKAFRSMAQGMKEGFGNLYKENDAFRQSVDGLKASMVTMKNGFAAAFAPLVQMAIPYVQQAVEWISVFIGKVGQFISAITGQKTYTKAIKQTTTAMKEQEKEQEKQLSGLDKLNNLSEGQGGGAAGGTGVSFEEVPIENEVLGMVDGLKNAFAPLKEAWDEFGPSIMDSLGNILQKFLDFGSRIGTATAEWFADLDWGPILSSVDELMKNLEPLVDLILDGLAWAWEHVLLPFGTWAIEKAIPVVLGLVSKALGALEKVLDTLMPLATWLWDEFLSPLGQWAGDVVLGALEKLGGLLEDFGNWISENQELVQGFVIVIASFFAAWKISSLVAGMVPLIASLVSFVTTGGLAATAAGVLGSAITFLTSPIGIATALIGSLIAIGVLLYKNWEEVSAFLTDVFAKDWTETFGILGSVMNVFFDLVGGIWDSIKVIFTGVIDMITGVFTGDWERAWNGVLEIFKGILNIFPTIVESVFNGILDIINGIIGGINFISGAIGIPAIPEIPKVSLPRLATGTVVPPNREFLAVLGDNKQEPEVVSPISTMKQAFLEAIEEAGGVGAGNGGEVTLNLTVECEGFRLLQLMQKLDREYFKQNGRHALA